MRARLDERSEQDLSLLRSEGHSDSEAIRLAFHEAAELRRRKSAPRLEAEAAAVDPDDGDLARMAAALGRERDMVPLRQLRILAELERARVRSLER